MLSFVYQALYAITTLFRKAELLPPTPTIPDYYVTVIVACLDIGQLSGNYIRTDHVPLNRLGLQPPFKLNDLVYIPFFFRAYQLQEMRQVSAMPRYDDGVFYEADFVYRTSQVTEYLFILVPADFYDPSSDISSLNMPLKMEPDCSWWTQMTGMV